MTTFMSYAGSEPDPEVDLDVIARESENIDLAETLKSPYDSDAEIKADVDFTMELLVGAIEEGMKTIRLREEKKARDAALAATLPPGLPLPSSARTGSPFAPAVSADRIDNTDHLPDGQENTLLEGMDSKLLPEASNADIDDIFGVSLEQLDETESGGGDDGGIAAAVAAAANLGVEETFREGELERVLATLYPPPKPKPTPVQYAPRKTMGKKQPKSKAKEDKKKKYTKKRYELSATPARQVSKKRRIEESDECSEDTERCVKKSKHGDRDVEYGAGDVEYGTASDGTPCLLLRLKGAEAEQALKTSKYRHEKDEERCTRRCSECCHLREQLERRIKTLEDQLMDLADTKIEKKRAEKKKVGSAVTPAVRRTVNKSSPMKKKRGRGGADEWTPEEMEELERLAYHYMGCSPGLGIAGNKLAEAIVGANSPKLSGRKESGVQSKLSDLNQYSEEYRERMAEIKKNGPPKPPPV